MHSATALAFAGRDLMVSGDLTVVLYYAYILDAEDRIQKRHDFEAADDAAALKHARRGLDRNDVEVWQLARMVARLVYGKQLRVVWPPVKKPKNGTKL